MKKFATTTILSLIALLGLTTSGITSSFAANDKITICHRTDSVTNPYVQITVDPNAADGDTGNDNGQGDHAAEHQGPVPTNETEAQALKDSHIEWGDIIPPHDNFPGLNWTADGQAIYNNGCNYTSVTPTQTPTPTGETTPTPSETITPTGEVTPSPTSEITPTVTITPTEKPSITPSPTNPCEGASCNTGGNTPTPSEEITPSPSIEVTPTTTIGIGGEQPTATPAPATTETNSPTATPTTQPGVSSTSTPSATSTTPEERVLGASAMANTGKFEENMMNLLGVFGMLLIAAGFISHKKRIA